METLTASWSPHRWRLLRFRRLDYEGINLLIALCERLVTKLQSCEICTPDAGLRFLSGREGGEEKEEIGSQRKEGKGDAEEEGRERKAAITEGPVETSPLYFVYHNAQIWDVEWISLAPFKSKCALLRRFLSLAEYGAPGRWRGAHLILQDAG